MATVFPEGSSCTSACVSPCCFRIDGPCLWKAKSPVGCSTQRFQSCSEHNHNHQNYACYTEIGVHFTVFMSHTPHNAVTSIHLVSYCNTWRGSRGNEGGRFAKELFYFSFTCFLTILYTHTNTHGSLLLSSCALSLVTTVPENTKRHHWVDSW